MYVYVLYVIVYIGTYLYVSYCMYCTYGMYYGM